MQPQKIALDQIASVIADTFKRKDEITCYLGSNAATPTASIEGLKNPRCLLSKWFICFYRGPCLMLRPACRIG
jgi:hypothetical protein